MEPFDPAAQADKFEQAIRDRLAQCDWRNPAERQAVYDGISASVGERVVRLRSSGKTESADVVERALTQAIEQVEWQVARGSDRADGGVHVQAQTREAEAGRPGAHATPATRGRRQAAVRKGWTTAALAAGLVLVLGLQAWQMFGAEAMARLGYPPAGCGPESAKCLDTGWQPVSNKASSAFFYRHNLGRVPGTVTVWYSPNANGNPAYSVSGNLPNSPGGNPYTIEARPDMVLLHIWKGAPIHSVYDGPTEKFTTYGEGYYRVVAE